MEDHELKKVLVQTCPVLPGQEGRAWGALRGRMFDRPAAFSPSWGFWHRAVLCSAVVAVPVAVAAFWMGRSSVIATADSQAPGIYATSFYSPAAKAQVVWLNGMEPASDRPTYLDTTGVVANSSDGSASRAAIQIVFEGEVGAPPVRSISLNPSAMHLFAKLFALTLFLSAGGICSVHAGEKLRVSLYFAHNGFPTPGVPMAPEKLQPRLREVFGFHYYQLRKSEEISLRNEWEQWFLPRKDFFLRLEPLHHPPGDPAQIDYEIYKDGFIVAKGRYLPAEDTPLFINGPDFHQGRFIFVLEAR